MSRGNPGEGLSGLVIGGNEGIDGLDEILDAGEGAAPNRLSGDDAKEDFDLVEP